jgi:hypothetical protein
MSNRSSWSPEAPLTARCTCGNVISPRYSAGARECSQCVRDRQRAAEYEACEVAAREEHDSIDARAKRIQSGAAWA